MRGGETFLSEHLSTHQLRTALHKTSLSVSHSSNSKHPPTLPASLPPRTIQVLLLHLKRRPHRRENLLDQRRVFGQTEIAHRESSS